jgi:hypothetical protein
MHGTPILDAEGRVIGIACSRTKGPRSAPCSACGKPGKQLCDGKGCDKPLCASCSVSPTPAATDYCPACFAPAWAHWKVRCGGAEVYRRQGRPAARIHFRGWVKKNPLEFLSLVVAARR